jgi:hypothetical protein
MEMIAVKYGWWSTENSFLLTHGVKKFINRRTNYIENRAVP